MMPGRAFCYQCLHLQLLGQMYKASITDKKIKNQSNYDEVIQLGQNYGYLMTHLDTRPGMGASPSTSRFSGFEQIIV